MKAISFLISLLFIQTAFSGTIVGVSEDGANRVVHVYEDGKIRSYRGPFAYKPDFGELEWLGGDLKLPEGFDPDKIVGVSKSSDGMNTNLYIVENGKLRTYRGPFTRFREFGDFEWRGGDLKLPEGFDPKSIVGVTENKARGNTEIHIVRDGKLRSYGGPFAHKQEFGDFEWTGGNLRLPENFDPSKIVGVTSSSASDNESIHTIKDGKLRSYSGPFAYKHDFGDFSWTGGDLKLPESVLEDTCKGSLSK